MSWDWKRLMIGGMAVVLLSSCSGDGDTAAPSASTTAATEVSTTVRPVDTSATGQTNADFCGQAKTYSERSAGVSGASSPAELRSALQDARTAIGDLAGAAPAEVRPDVLVLAQAFDTLFTELEKVNFDPSRVSLAAFAPLQAPEFVQSSTRFQEYVRTACGTG